LAAELRDQFDVEAELIESSGGIFDVRVDGKLIFSKSEVDRFPAPGEVASLIQGS